MPPRIVQQVHRGQHDPAGGRLDDRTVVAGPVAVQLLRLQPRLALVEASDDVGRQRGAGASRMAGVQVHFSSFVFEKGTMIVPLRVRSTSRQTPMANRSVCWFILACACQDLPSSVLRNGGSPPMLNRLPSPSRTNGPALAHLEFIHAVRQPDVGGGHLAFGRCRRRMRWDGGLLPNGAGVAEQDECQPTWQQESSAHRIAPPREKAFDVMAEATNSLRGSK